MELHLRALVVVPGAGLVDVVGLHLVRPVHLTHMLVLAVQPGAVGRSPSLCRGQGAGPTGTLQGKPLPHATGMSHLPRVESSGPKAHLASSVQEQLPLPLQEAGLGCVDTQVPQAMQESATSTPTWCPCPACTPGCNLGQGPTSLSLRSP